MTKTKERIVTISSLDGEQRGSSERIGMVYKRADGSEWVHHINGLRKIERRDGVATLVVNIRTIKARRASDVLGQA